MDNGGDRTRRAREIIERAQREAQLKAAQEAERQRREEAEQRRQYLADYTPRLALAVNEALARLDHQGLPGVEMVRVHSQAKNFWGAYRYHSWGSPVYDVAEIPGWKVYREETTVGHSHSSATVYLLTDGALYLESFYSSSADSGPSDYQRRERLSPAELVATTGPAVVVAILAKLGTL